MSWIASWPRNSEPLSYTTTPFNVASARQGCWWLSYAWLASSPAGVSRSDIRECISSNLCRCTGYSSIVNAVEGVALRRADRGPDHA